MKNLEIFTVRERFQRTFAKGSGNQTQYLCPRCLKPTCKENIGMVCPECKASFPRNLARSLTHKIEDNAFVDNIVVFEHGDHIIISQLITGYGIDLKDHLFSKRWRTTACLNTKTGKTFILPVKGANREDPVYGFVPFITPTLREISCHSYCGGVLFDPEAVKYVLKLFFSKKNFPKDIIDEWEANLSHEPFLNRIKNLGGEKTLFRMVCVLNRFPALRIGQVINIQNFFQKLGCLSYSVDKERVLEKILDTKQEDIFSNAEFTEKVLENCCVKSCDITRKIVAENITKVMALWTFGHCGFEDVNLIDSFFDFYEKANVIGFDESFFEFVKRLIAINGEAATMEILANALKGKKPKVCSIIVAQKAAVIEDTAKTYVSIATKEPSIIEDELLKGSIAEMNQELHSILDNIKDKNYVIPCSDDNYDLDTDVSVDDGFYEFQTIKDTNELLKASNKIDICLRDYVDIALKGESIIVIAYYHYYDGDTFNREKSDPRIFIELEKSDSGYIMKQAKSSYIFSGEIAFVLKTWAEEVGNINIDDCSDYQHIKDGNIYKDCNTDEDDYTISVFNMDDREENIELEDDLNDIFALGL